jgi:Astacin (Peptidase family M12A)
MHETGTDLREALKKIAKVASAAIGGSEYEGNGHNDDEAQEDSLQQYMVGCTLKSLPKRLLVKAADTAVKTNPVNAPALAPMAGVAADVPLEPMRIAVLTSKYWGPAPRRLTVSFMESTPADLRARILSHMNAWASTAGISFVETQGTGEVRISRGPGGYWSYLGTDIRLIPQNRPTMNLQGFTMNTPESEYRRVVRHEAGHTLGFPHEHMRQALVARIDPAKAYEYFQRTQGWDQRMVDQQVLTPLNERSIFGTPPDQDSIMCYQLPEEITRDGQPIRGGRDINQTDYGFAGVIYPKFGFAPTSADAQMYPYADDWDESEDVKVAV